MYQSADREAADVGLIVLWTRKSIFTVTRSLWSEHVRRQVGCHIDVSSSTEQSPWEADSRLTSQEVPSFCGTRRFISVLIRGLHRPPPWATWINCTPFHLKNRFNTVLSSSQSFLFRVISCLPAFQPKFLPISHLHTSYIPARLLIDLIILEMFSQM
jgi:hypothetical protein